MADVIVETLSETPFTGDERNLIRSDVHQVALLAYALTGQTIIPEAAGVWFLSGGPVTAARKRRWWDACSVVNSLTLTINPITCEWVKLGIADPDGRGGVRLGPPAWWSGKGHNSAWRLSGGLWRPPLGSRSGYGAILGAGMRRTVAGLESRLWWSPTAGRGRGGRIADTLRPVRPGGPGLEAWVPWRDVLTLSGEPVSPDAAPQDKEGRRYRRRRDALVDAGYQVLPPAGSAAPAGDTVEITKVVLGGRGHEAGLRIRARGGRSACSEARELGTHPGGAVARRCRPGKRHEVTTRYRPPEHRKSPVSIENRSDPTGPTNPSRAVVGRAALTGPPTHQAKHHNTAAQSTPAAAIPTKLRKDTERRALELTETVEAEAMPAATLRALLVDAIESHLPPGICWSRICCPGRPVA